MDQVEHVGLRGRVLRKMNPREGEATVLSDRRGLIRGRETVRLPTCERTWLADLCRPGGLRVQRRARGAARAGFGSACARDARRSFRRFGARASLARGEDRAVDDVAGRGAADGAARGAGERRAGAAGTHRLGHRGRRASRASRELQRVAVEESPHRIPLLFSLDVIHGYRTNFPVPLAEAASFDPALAETDARIAADEATANGIEWNVRADGRHRARSALGANRRGRGRRAVPRLGVRGGARARISGRAPERLRRRCSRRRSTSSATARRRAGVTMRRRR